MKKEVRTPHEMNSGNNMKLPLRIALRYFNSRNSTQAINIVSWISMGAVALSTTAMVVLFSVYNGLESYVKSMYTAFYPEIKVSPVNGKFFEFSASRLKELRQVQGIAHIGLSVEDMALLEGRDHQKVVRLKGVNNEWFAANGMQQHVNTGTASWPESSEVLSNIGVDIVAEMGIELQNPLQKIQLYYPRSDASFSGLDAATALRGLAVAPYGSFHIQPELDGQFVLIPLADAQDLFDVGHKISAVEISLKKPENGPKIIERLKKMLGKDLKVLDRMEQNKTLFMATEMEKWMIYGILLMVLVVSSFNMVGALSMLAIEKKLDISVLRSMGAAPKVIKRTFLNLGSLIAVAGGLIGLILGLIIVLAQMQWGFIEMGEGFMEAYPVELQAMDLIVVCVTVVVVGFAAAWYPAHRASKQMLIFRDE